MHTMLRVLVMRILVFKGVHEGPLFEKQPHAGRWTTTRVSQPCQSTKHVHRTKHVNDNVGSVTAAVATVITVVLLDEALGIRYVLKIRIGD